MAVTIPCGRPEAAFEKGTRLTAARASRCHHNLTPSGWQLSCPPSLLHEGTLRTSGKSLGPGALGLGAA